MREWQWVKYSEAEQEKIRCHAQVPFHDRSRRITPETKRCVYRSVEGGKFCRVHPEGNKPAAQESA